MNPGGSEICAPGSAFWRACDQCRLRKIRCDKRFPCANCRSSQIICRSTGAGQKPPESRTRVLITGQYERKIDAIEKRLGGIEEILLDLRANASKVDNTTPAQSEPINSFTASLAETLEQHEPANLFEGSSSFTAHSAYASQFLETAVSKGHMQMPFPKMEAALSTLKQLVSLQKIKPSEKRSGYLFRRKTSSLRGLPLPPADLVLRVLREIKDKPLPWMQGLAFLGIDRVIEKCREVFFASDDFSEEAFVIANGALYFIFADYMFMDKSQQMRDTYRKCMDLTRANLEFGLADLSLFMPATPDAISALSLGAIHAIEISKPSFALTLISTAASMCQTLGYHQTSSIEHDSDTMKKDKLTLFYAVYYIDKALSFRLGRSATIQDYDISVPMAMNLPGILEPWNTIYNLWIDYARMQGMVYEMLYSPMALNQSEEQRGSQARKLASEFQETVIETHKRKIDRQSLSMYDSLQVKADEVAYLALLTMIYRAIPAQDDVPESFTSECIETARAALECHQESFHTLKDLNESQVILSYLHWTILHSPFVPFIVLCCNVVGSHSITDLQRLEDFVASLQPYCILSEAISKLHCLCQILTNITRLYLEAKAQSQTQAGQSLGQEFDTYLSALGLAPMAPDAPGEQALTTSTSSVPRESTEAMHDMQTPVGAPLALQNWYSGNQYIMGLLEEDLSLFDASDWR